MPLHAWLLEKILTQKTATNGFTAISHITIPSPTNQPKYHGPTERDSTSYAIQESSHTGVKHKMANDIASLGRVQLLVLDQPDKGILMAIGILMARQGIASKPRSQVI